MREFKEVKSVLKFKIVNANGPAALGLNCRILSVDIIATAMSHQGVLLCIPSARSLLFHRNHRSVAVASLGSVQRSQNLKPSLPTLQTKSLHPTRVLKFLLGMLKVERNCDKSSSRDHVT